MFVRGCFFVKVTHAPVKISQNYWSWHKHNSVHLVLTGNMASYKTLLQESFSKTSNKHILKEGCLTLGSSFLSKWFSASLWQRVCLLWGRETVSLHPVFRKCYAGNEVELKTTTHTPPHPPPKLLKLPSLCAAKTHRGLPEDISLKSKHILSSHGICILSVSSDELTVWLNLPQFECTTDNWGNKIA